MPRFYLHIVDDGDRILDQEGSEYADASEARVEAVESAIDLVCDSLRAGEGLRLNRSFLIAGEDGEVVEEITFERATKGRPQRAKRRRN
jgi:phosphohistidine phosphatase SixA